MALPEEIPGLLFNIKIKFVHVSSLRPMTNFANPFIAVSYSFINGVLSLGTSSVRIMSKYGQRGVCVIGSVLFILIFSLHWFFW